MTTFSSSGPRSARRSAWPVVAALVGLLLLAFGAVLGWRIVMLLPPLAGVLLAFLALRALFCEVRTRARELPSSGELPYGFAGHEIRAFCDATGAIWLRADDVRHALALERSDAWMARAYPDDFRRAHPWLPAWFISPEAVRRHWARSVRIDVNRFLAWMDRDLIPLHRKRAVVVPASEPLPDPAGFVVRHWRGEHPLLHFALSGLLLLAMFGLILGGRGSPAEVVAHYQRWAFVGLLELVAGTLLAAWWGVGAWRSAQRWLGAGRSLLAGMAFAIAGMSGLLYAFSRVADFDQHMTLFALVRMATDSDVKPRLALSADGQRLRLDGEMGFGTTRAVREALARHRGVTGIELQGPGGSAYEGLVLAALVSERGLATYVRGDCASACVLVFSGGQPRLAAPGARFGLHRSGISWRRGNGGLSQTDLDMGDFFAKRGVSAAFIKQALATPFEEIWVPEPAEVLAAGLATGLWEDPPR